MSQLMLDQRSEQSLKDTALLVYILLLISLFTAIPTGLVGAVVAYVKRPEAKDSWLESHFDAQLRIFIKSLVGFALGILFCITIVGVVIGVPLLIITWLWTVYSCAIGIRNLHDRRETQACGRSRRRALAPAPAAPHDYLPVLMPNSSLPSLLPTTCGIWPSHFSMARARKSCSRLRISRSC